MNTCGVTQLDAHLNRQCS